MRIAWIGPMPNNGGGATGVGRQLLVELSRQGVEVDCFFPGKESAIPEVMLQENNLRFFCQPSSWEWNRWYSRNNFMAFATGQIANLRCEMKLAEQIVNRHRMKPYDLIYQFSHIEMHALKKYKHRLPPILLHPSVHAAGELRWHKKEAALAKLSESLFTRLSVRLLLTVRSIVQKRHAQQADYILGISKTFAGELSADYNLKPEQVSYIVPNPIDVERFTPKPEVGTIRSDKRITFLFVSRISVRKGTEMIVELSHRLKDLTGKVHILIVGNHSLWSDYRGLLKQLNPDIATYKGQISGGEMDHLYNSVDALIQPSHYEPFGLTVGEALACGLPVISSDKVGAAEEVSSSCCRTFPIGDMAALEHQVRVLYNELQTPKRDEIAGAARSEAIRLFSDSVIVANLVSVLHQVVSSEHAEKKRKSISKRNMAVNG